MNRRHGLTGGEHRFWPADFHPLNIGTDRILGFHRHEMDVERLELRAPAREITGNRTPTGD